MDGSTVSRGSVEGQLAVDSRVEFGVAVQSQHKPTAPVYHWHAAGPEASSAVVGQVAVVRATTSWTTTEAVTPLRRVIDNNIFLIIIIIIVAIVVVFVVVVILPGVCRTVDSAAAANERSERVADLAAGVRVRQVQTDVDQCT